MLILYPPLHPCVHRVANDTATCAAVQVQPCAVYVAWYTSAVAAAAGCCFTNNETLQPGVLAGDGEDGVIVVYKDADTVPSIK
jgi:hypothetical protein